MKKYTQSFAIILILTFLVGCASNNAVKIQASVNNYYYYTNRFEEVCPSYDSSVCTEYKVQATLLQRWEKLLKEATEAVNRGGELPLQLKALDKVEKELKDKTHGW
jgi:hypothetical protein